jgi:hypothetical protein
MAGDAYHCTVVQVLLLHKTYGEFVQQGLQNQKAQAKEEYCTEQFKDKRIDNVFKLVA